MNKQRIAQILTVLILAGVLGGTLIKKNRWTFRTTRAAMRPADATPEDAIYSMLDAARKGDVQKYLASYSGPMQASLRQSIAESSNSAFGQYLQDTNAALKGVAGSAPLENKHGGEKSPRGKIEHGRKVCRTLVTKKDTNQCQTTR